MGLLLAETLHVFWILGEILRQPSDLAGEVTSEIITGASSSGGGVAELLLQALPNEFGSREPTRFRCSLESLQ